MTAFLSFAVTGLILAVLAAGENAHYRYRNDNRDYKQAEDSLSASVQRVLRRYYLDRFLKEAFPKYLLAAIESNRPEENLNRYYPDQDEAINQLSAAMDRNLEQKAFKEAVDELSAAIESSQDRNRNDLEEEAFKEAIDQLNTAIESNLNQSSNDLEQEALEEAVNELSAAIRNVGVGYNILKGSPDGDFNRGGIDPGILVTRHVFEFTYDKGNMAFYMGQALEIPDQVSFQSQNSCSARHQIKLYSGAKSYRDSLKLGASPGGIVSNYILCGTPKCRHL